MTRHIVVGDIHGCIDEFRELLNQINFDPDEDYGISLGDIVDRGPDPASCLALAKDNGFVLIAANHEDRLLRWQAKELLVATKQLKRNDVKLRSVHKRSLENISCHERAPELWDYMRSAPLVYQITIGTTVYHCVHGGYHPGMGPETPRNWMIRMRDIDSKRLAPVKSKKGYKTSGKFWADLWKGPQKVVFGHNVFEDAKFFPYAIGIDTGCCFGGKLTALIVHSNGCVETTSVNSRRNYCVRK